MLLELLIGLKGDRRKISPASTDLVHVNPGWKVDGRLGGAVTSQNT